jgi:hypothetical protein
MNQLNTGLFVAFQFSVRFDFHSGSQLLHNSLAYTMGAKQAAICGSHSHAKFKQLRAVFEQKLGSLPF